MPNLVCTGATLRCSFGALPSTFAASGIQTSTGSPVGVVADVTPENVLPFGVCSSPKNPGASASVPPACVPVLLDSWTPGSARVSIDGVSALDDSCTCTCTWEGVVTVTDAGQTAASDE